MKKVSQPNEAGFIVTNKAVEPAEVKSVPKRAKKKADPEVVDATEAVAPETADAEVAADVPSEEPAAEAN